MRHYRFLLSRRWAVFAVVVVLMAYAAWRLGEWQWHRLEGRKAANAIITTNERLPPGDPAQVMGAAGQDLDGAQGWRTVRATGTYDVAHTVIVRYREDDHGQSGVDLVVPLRLANGMSLLVDRGFLATDATPTTPADVPAPPAGTVTVTGYARANGSGDSTEVSDGSTRAISSTAIGAATGLQVYGGFVQASSESPSADPPLGHGDLPDLGNGPHFFYALQWWFFGLLAIFGFGYLAYDERKLGPRGTREQARTAPPPAEREATPEPVLAGAAPAAQSGEAATSGGPVKPVKPVKVKKVRQTNVNAAYQRPRRKPPSTGTIAPETNEAAGESTKAATRPNSSGRP